MGLSRLISGAALAVMVLVRRFSALPHATNGNRILDLVLLGEARRELRSTNWIDSDGSCRPESSEWPFPTERES